MPMGFSAGGQGTRCIPGGPERGVEGRHFWLPRAPFSSPCPFSGRRPGLLERITCFIFYTLAVSLLLSWKEVSAGSSRAGIITWRLWSKCRN